MKDKDLCNSLVSRYIKYIIEEHLSQFIHKYDTQTNEALNTAVAKHAPKSITYGKLMSVEARVNIAASVFICGHSEFWTKIFFHLGMVINPEFSVYLRDKDKRKLHKDIRKNENVDKAKWKRREHDRLSTEVSKRLQDVQINLVYKSKVGCEVTCIIIERNEPDRKSVVCNNYMHDCTIPWDKWNVVLSAFSMGEIKKESMQLRKCKAIICHVRIVMIL